MTTPQPNPQEHPEIIEWMNKYREAQRDIMGLNLDDPSNFLGNRDEVVKRLDDTIAHANQELQKWCKHYGIDYGGLKFPR